MSVAAAFAWMARAIAERTLIPHSWAATFGMVALEIILLAESRNALKKYYSQTQQLLNTRHC